MDTPTALYHVFVDGQIESRGPCPEGVGWLWPTMYLESLWNNRADRPVRQDLIALGRRLRRIKAFAQLSLGDPLPCLMHVQWRGRVWTAARARGVVARCVAALRQWRANRVASPLGG